MSAIVRMVNDHPSRCGPRFRLGWSGPPACRRRPLVTAALGAAPPGNGGWLVPIEPILSVRHARDAWAPALAALHLRAR